MHIHLDIQNTVYIILCVRLLTCLRCYTRRACHTTHCSARDHYT